MKRKIYYGKVIHKGGIYDVCFCHGDKIVNIHVDRKRIPIKDFKIITESLIYLGETNDY